MSRTILLSVIGGLLAFTAGIVTVQSWPKPVKPTPPKVEATPEPAPPEPELEITPDPEPSEVVFAKGRLRITTEEVHLKSEQRFYNIDVSYPQIVGSNARHIKNLNQRLRRFAINRYQWPLKFSKAELRANRFTFAESHNSVDVNYHIVLATDSILSIFIWTEDYYIGAAHSGIESHVINYDLKAHRDLKLADLFKPRSQYLEFIANYCTRELEVYGSLEPKPETFKSWNLTEDGIQFSFDPCQIAGCSSGPQDVTIPFSALTPFLKPNQTGIAN